MRVELGRARDENANIPQLRAESFAAQMDRLRCEKLDNEVATYETERNEFKTRLGALQESYWNASHAREATVREREQAQAALLARAARNAEHEAGEVTHLRQRDQQWEERCRALEGDLQRAQAEVTPRTTPRRRSAAQTQA